MADRTAENSLDECLDVALVVLDGGPRRVLSGRPCPSDVASLMRKVRALARLTDGWIAALGTVAQEHALAGEGPVLEEALAGDGDVPRSTVSSDVGRVRVLNHFAEVGAAIRNGSALPFNIGSLANTLSNVTAEEAESLAKFDGDFAERVSNAKPDSFRRYVNRCVDRIRRDHGLDATRRARAAASCSLSARRDRSGYRMILDLETERGTACFQRRSEREAKPGPPTGFGPWPHHRPAHGPGRT